MTGPSVGFVGLGAMGGPMARSWLEASNDRANTDRSGQGRDAVGARGRTGAQGDGETGRAPASGEAALSPTAFSALTT